MPLAARGTTLLTAHQISASQIGLLLICPGQAVLKPYGVSSDAAVDGTREHQDLVPAAAAGDLPDTLRGRGLRRFDVLVGAECEVPIAVNLGDFSARVLPSDGHRDYSAARPGEIVGTGDWLHVDAAWAGELKTGDVWVDAARWNAQLWFFGLALMFLRNSPDGIRLTLAQVSERGELRDTYCQPSGPQLWAYYDRLARLRDRVFEQTEKRRAGERLALVRGPHCRYCDAVLACPALSEGLGEGNPGQRYQRAAANLARAQAAELLARQTLSASSYELGDGNKLKRVDKWSRRVNAEDAIKAMPELAAVATEVPRSLRLHVGDIDAHAVATGTARYGTERKKELSAQLTNAGAMRHTHSETWKVTTNE